MKKCVLIYNPASGKGKTKIEKNLNEIKEKFYIYGYDLEIITTKYKGHAIEIVENLNKADLVVSIGGDGTFNEIMTGNFKRDARLLVAHIPLGTTNDLGNMFGYGKKLINNIELLLTGVKRKIDICTINGQPFVYCAGFGKFVNISYDTPRKLKEKFGYVAYWMKGVKEINNETKLYDIEYEIDGNIYCDKCSFMMVSNANRVAGIKTLYEDIKLNDSKFEVLFCKFNKKNDIGKILYYLASKNISASENFKFYKTDNLKIKFKDKQLHNWSIDGEKFETEDVCDIKIVKGIEILMPSKNISNLFV